jgi:hypothetical protein
LLLAFWNHLFIPEYNDVILSQLFFWPLAAAHKMQGKYYFLREKYESTADWVRPNIDQYQGEGRHSDASR